MSKSQTQNGKIKKRLKRLPDPTAYFRKLFPMKDQGKAQKMAQDYAITCKDVYWTTGCKPDRHTIRICTTIPQQRNGQRAKGQHADHGYSSTW